MARLFLRCPTTLRTGVTLVLAVFLAVLLCAARGENALAALGQSENEVDPLVMPFPETLRFEHLTTEDGLSQNTVFFVHQDRQGFLWIGTQDGLNRYDGYHYSIYRHEPEDANSLSNSAVLALEEDLDGSLWLGTWGGGLNHFDPRTGKFVRYRHNPADPASLSGDLVSAVFFDRSGRMWVGTMGGGLNRMDLQTGQFTHYSLGAGRGTNYISSIAQDADGWLWLGTGGFGTEGSGLIHFDPSSGRSVIFTSQPGDPTSLSSNTISALVMDADGWLWVATGGYNVTGRGLNHFNPMTGQVERYWHDPRQAASLASDNLLSLFLDATGRLWIGTADSGLDRLDASGDTLRFLHYPHDPYDATSLNGDAVWSISQDRTGVIWLGTMLGGVNKINPEVQRFRLYRRNPENGNSLTGNVVGPMVEDQQGDIWIGTLGFGLDRFNRQTGIFKHYPVSAIDPLYQQASHYTALLEDQSGRIWAGTMAGLASVDTFSRQFVYYRHDSRDPDSLVSNSVAALAEDLEGRLWVATQGGLDWFDEDQKHFVHVQIPEAGPGNALYIDRYGRLWLATWGTGLFALDLSTLQGSSVRYTWYQNQPNQSDSLGDNSIWSVYEDPDGSLWLATGRGLDHFDPAAQRFTHYRTEDGLANNNVLCVLQDGQDRLWISTNGGLSRFDRQSSHFRTYDAHDGLQGNQYENGSCLRTRSGDMYFGGANGLSAFNPEEIQDNPTPPTVVVTNFSIFNQAAEVDLSGSSPIQLTYKQNFIAFEFVALDFHDPLKNQYEYKLEGFDQDWVRAALGRYASYTNLPGGNYTFRVRASNNDGIWNEQGAAVPISVALPYWETWWFRGGLALLLVLIVAGGIQIYLLNIRVQNRRLEALVEQRTHRLQVTNDRLEHEMEQRQKAEETLAQKAAEEAVTTERSRLARDLHDAVTQTLFSASLIAEVLPDLWKTDTHEALESTDELRQLTRGALAEMRTLLLELRPSALTQARYEDLLRQLVEAVVGRARLPIDLRVEGSRSLAPEVQIALYRIAQEALNNIVKYAKATQVCIELQMSEAGLLLSIQDNGIGFQPAAVKPASMGLVIMRERAEGIHADLTLISAPGQGTRVEVSWNDPDYKELE